MGHGESIVSFQLLPLLALSRKVLPLSEPQFLLQQGRRIRQPPRVCWEGSFSLCTCSYHRRPGSSESRPFKGEHQRRWGSGGSPPFPAEEGSHCPQWAPTVRLLRNTCFPPVRFGTCRAESDWVASPSEDLQALRPAP